MLLPSSEQRREAPRDPDAQAQACHPGPLHSCLGNLSSAAPAAPGFRSALAPGPSHRKGLQTHKGSQGRLLVTHPFQGNVPFSRSANLLPEDSLVLVHHL